ncbi:phage tail tube protein [Bryobacter aggregatus]|uniref:phage tail tube protein n=1 Tax=Bryobacter aggregatus TaxID=360054 RepID=UPI0004E210CA|nr:phage tail tube protein [Bryobacter aggregatus]
MANEYIATLSNRIFIKSEVDDPEVGNMEAAQLAPVTAFQVNSNRKRIFRRDKTGYRSDNPVVGPQRELIEFSMDAYGTGWTGGTEKPAIAPLLESALCQSASLGTSYIVQSSSGKSVTLAADGMLSVGMGLAFGSELRFVESISGPRDFTLNTAFSVDLTAGAELAGCVNLSLGDTPSTMSVLDTWAPNQAVQRFLTGAISDKLSLKINNDFLEISTKGFARNLVDSVSGSVGADSTFPAAPPAALTSTPIAGYLGQAFLGVATARLCTLTQATIHIDNDIQPRTDEFGCFSTKGFVLGRRKVSLDLTVFERNDELSQALYTRAVNNEPVSVMLQIGNQPGSMFAIYLPAVLFPVPAFNDGQSRLLWQFRNAVALGMQNDEVFLAMR